MAGVVFDGLIGNWSVASCWRLPTQGSKGCGAGNEMFQRADADRRKEGGSSTQVLVVVAPEGGPRGAAPRAKTSTTIMRPPQHGHGGRWSVVASGSGMSCTTGGSTSAIGAAINCLARAMLVLQPALASSP